MAYTNVQSGEIAEGAQYYSGKLPIGDYNFYLQFDATGVSPKIIAQCVSPNGEVRTSASRTWPSGTQVRGWSVEANETEASIYVKLFSEGVDLPTTQLSYFEDWWVGPGIIRTTHEISNTVIFSSSSHKAVLASASPFSDHYTNKNIVIGEGTYYADAYTKSGKTVYYLSQSYTNAVDVLPNTGAVFPGLQDSDIAWSMVYNRPIDEDFLIARFQINISDAGGYPGGSGNWIEPGDYDISFEPIEWGDPDYPDIDDPDYPEPIFPDDPDYPDIDDPDYPGDQDGDGFPDPYHPDYYPPPKTLSVTITGATSGAHSNNVPDENKNVAGYGCGGYGGHGGGGGAGASTIIVNSFATDKADYKEINAIAQRHGYGSGGGKGGTGGDGCILVYY